MVAEQMVPVQMANVIKGLFIEYCRDNEISDIGVETIQTSHGPYNNNLDLPSVRISKMDLDEGQKYCVTILITKYYTDLVMSSVDNFTEAGKSIYPGFISKSVEYLQNISSMN